MRKIILEIAVSIDGFIEGPSGELDWLIYDDFTCANDFLSGFDTIFFGRVAYERFGVPRSEDKFNSTCECEINNGVNRMRKYVFSHTVKHVNGNGMVINENILGEIERIRDEDGKNIWLCGGASILSTFIHLDLVDEYILAMQPTILGSGKPLFKNLVKPLNLELVKTQVSKSGVVMLHYQSQNKRPNNLSYDRSF